jgi:hypothetical protein
MSTFLQARATHICLDCGFIYFLQKPFDDQVSLVPELHYSSLLKYDDTMFKFVGKLKYENNGGIKREERETKYYGWFNFRHLCSPL